MQQQPLVRPYHAMMSRFFFFFFFLRYTSFSEKCTEWPQMTLKCPRSKIPICMLPVHTPLSQNFRPFRSRFLSRFRVTPLSWKVHRMIPKSSLHVQGQGYTHAYCIHPRCPFFRPFRSTMTRFRVRPLFFCKRAPNDPKWPWHVQGLKSQYASYIHPRSPNFRRFCS